MTRTIVYSGVLVAFAAATALTLVATLTPRWVSYAAASPAGDATFGRWLGLHESCSSLADPPCRPFPRLGYDCTGDASFCPMWRSAGRLMGLAAAMELLTVVTLVAVLAGGKARRETRWRLVAGMMLGVAAVQFVVAALAAYLLDNDEQFLVPGWRLDSSWVFCAISACVASLCAVGLAVSTSVLPPEPGYVRLKQEDCSA